MLNEDLIAGRSEDAELTDRGCNDAFDAGKKLARRGTVPDLVVSSSAVRCVQTAELLLAAMRLARPIHKTDQLLEMDHGDFVGLDRREVYTDEIKRQIKLHGKNFALPGGESMNDVGKRGIDWLASIQGATAKKTVVVLAVAHAGLITNTAGTLCDWDQPTSYRLLKTVKPLSETVVGFDGKRWYVRSFAQSL